VTAEACIHQHLARLAAELQQGVPPGHRLAELRYERDPDDDAANVVRVVATWEPE